MMRERWISIAGETPKQWQSLHFWRRWCCQKNSDALRTFNPVPYCYRMQERVWWHTGEWVKLISVSRHWYRERELSQKMNNRTAWDIMLQTNLTKRVRTLSALLSLSLSLSASLPSPISTSTSSHLNSYHCLLVVLYLLWFWSLLVHGWSFLNISKYLDG